MSDQKPANPPVQSYFKKANRAQSKAKIALTGPSGSGKTLSSLLLAKGLTGNGRVAVIDSENNSASLYEDRFPDWEYFTLPINPPYTAKRYMWAIDQAIKEGFECIVIDSLTHVWAAEGGLLQQKEALDSRGGNSFTNWGAITKMYEELKSKILHSPVHMIVTMRSKQEYILEQTSNGKQAPKKVGLAPIMRDGMEYEFTVVFDIGMDHQYMSSKDRTDLFDGQVATITEQTGIDLRAWLRAPTPPPPPPKTDPPSSTPSANQEHPPEQFDKMPDHENETQERRPPTRSRKPQNHAPAARADIDVLYNLCIDRGIPEGDLILLVSEGYGFPFDKMPGWVQAEVGKLLENEDFDLAACHQKTDFLKGLREESDRVRKAKGYTDEMRTGGGK